MGMLKCYHPRRLRDSKPQMRRLMGVASLALLLLSLPHLTRGSKSGNPRLTRKDRFPSVEQRLKIYMSNWYVPPCEGYTKGRIRYRYIDHPGEWPAVQLQGSSDHPGINESNLSIDIESFIKPDTVLFLDRETTLVCANLTEAFHGESTKVDPAKLRERVTFPWNMRMYCYDAIDSLLPAYDFVTWESESVFGEDMSGTPLLVQFGDNRNSHVFGNFNIPHIKKFRSAVDSDKSLATVTSENCFNRPPPYLQTVHSGDLETKYQPIVWKFATSRHFDKTYQIYQMDMPWSKKKDMAVFRGQLTGARYFYDPNLPARQNCQNMIRCRLVFENANSTLIDAKLTSTRDRVPDSIDGVSIVGKKVFIDSLLEFKGIIMIEGNDVASGLKWALLSQSVVLMPTPRYTSWAMEELLEPWVHYVPLDDDASNVNERMQWVLDNEEKARIISEQATLWMEDLVFHPDAAEDDRIIQEEIIRRYLLHFEKA